MIRQPDRSWSFRDVVFEAHFRASITRLRYRVWYDRANSLWNLTESTVPLPSGQQPGAGDSP